jgi:hypothetical protein
MHTIFTSMAAFVLKMFLFDFITAVDYLCPFGINYFNNVHSVQLYVSFVQLVGFLIIRSITVTWVITLGLGGTKSTMGISNFSLRSQDKDRRKMGLRQSLIHIYSV